MDISYAKKPSAWIPVAMSLSAFALVGIQLGTRGVAPEHDEGAVAHVWQLLMAAQIPIIAFFALRWMRRAPGKAATVMATQILAAAAAAIPVYLLGW